MTSTVAPTSCTVSVVICTHTEERWDDLCAAVESLAEQVVQPEEVILVIDHAPRLLARAELAFPDILIAPNTQAKGISGARNTGIDLAAGVVVAFLDDDAAASPQWLASLVTAYEDEHVGGAGGRVVANWEGARPGWFPPEFDWVVGCTHSGMPESTRPVGNFAGANMSFRRDVLVQLGGFSSELGWHNGDGAGSEETDLCIRAMALDERSLLVYEPDAQVLHRVPEARGTWRYFLRRCYGEGRSKAHVADLVGNEKALSDGRTYLRRTVPLGIARSLREALGHPAAALQAIAGAAGTATTALGYGIARAGRQGLICSVGLMTAFALWIVTLVHGVPLAKMDDYGLLSVLPLTYWGALAILAAGFWLLVRNGASHRLLLGGYTLVLLAMFHATPTILYETLRYSWAWKHVAITGYVITHHGVNLTQPIPALVAYQDWPGFFTLNGILTAGSGFQTALSYASWGPFVNELLYAFPLMMIFRTFTGDKRLQWMALWFFYLGNWIGQDYFSPQGYAFFLYLVLIAICLRHFPNQRRRVHLATTDRGDTTIEDDSPAQLRQRRFYFALAILLIFVIASSHQLTPFMVVTGLVALTLCRRLHYRSLCLIAGAIAVAWLFLAACTFMQTNLPALSSGLGDLFSNASVHQINGGFANPDQLLISKVDRLLTAWTALLAFIGVARNWRSERRRTWLPVVALCCSPIAAFVGNSYGGEIVFRVFLFDLPFLSLLGAAAFFPIGAKRRSWARDVLSFAVIGVLLAGFIASYYGKEKTNYFSPQEVASFNRFYAHIPNGSYITGLVGNDPWPMKNYNDYTYYWYTQVGTDAVNALLTDPVGSIDRAMSDYRHSYFVFSSSDDVEVEEAGLLPKGDDARIRQVLLSSGLFKVVEKTPSVLVLTLGPKSSHRTTTSAVVRHTTTHHLTKAAS